MTKLRAANAWTLDGQRFDLQIEPGYYGANTLAFERRASSADAQECFAVVNGLVSDFEARFGAFEVPMSLREQRAPGQISVQRSGEAYPLIVGTPGDVTQDAAAEVDAGRHSELGVLTRGEANEPASQRGFGNRPADRRGRSANIDGDYEVAGGNPTCVVRAEVSQARRRRQNNGSAATHRCASRRAASCTIRWMTCCRCRRRASMCCSTVA